MHVLMKMAIHIFVSIDSHIAFYIGLYCWQMIPVPTNAGVVKW